MHLYVDLSEAKALQVIILKFPERSIVLARAGQAGILLVSSLLCWLGKFSGLNLPAVNINNCQSRRSWSLLVLPSVSCQLEPVAVPYTIAVVVYTLVSRSQTLCAPFRSCYICCTVSLIIHQ